MTYQARHIATTWLIINTITGRALYPPNGANAELWAKQTASILNAPTTRA